MKQFTHCQLELIKNCKRERKRKLECNELNEEEVESKIQILYVESMDKEELCEISKGMEMNMKEGKEENIMSDEKVFSMKFNVGKYDNNVELMQ